MAKKQCILCGEEIKEDYGKLQGTMVKVKNEKGKNEFIYVCSECMKKNNWLEDAKVKGV